MKFSSCRGFKKLHQQKQWHIIGTRLQYELKRKKWRNKVTGLVFFIIRQKFIYIVDKLLNKNRCEKIDAHVVLSFVFPTKTLLNKKLLNTVKYAQATDSSN